MADEQNTPPIDPFAAPPYEDLTAPVPQQAEEQQLVATITNLLQRSLLGRKILTDKDHPAAPTSLARRAQERAEEELRRVQQGHQFYQELSSRGIYDPKGDVLRGTMTVERQFDRKQAPVTYETPFALSRQEYEGLAKRSRISEEVLKSADDPERLEAMKGELEKAGGALSDPEKKKLQAVTNEIRGTLLDESTKGLVKEAKRTEQRQIKPSISDRIDSIWDKAIEGTLGVIGAKKTKELYSQNLGTQATELARARELAEGEVVAGHARRAEHPRSGLEDAATAALGIFGVKRLGRSLGERGAAEGIAGAGGVAAEGAIGGGALLTALPLLRTLLRAKAGPLALLGVAQQALSNYRDLTEAGQVTGEGFRAGLGQRAEAFWTGIKNPFDLITGHVASAIVKGVRQSGFSGAIAHAMDDNITNVVQDLGPHLTDQIISYFDFIIRNTGQTSEDAITSIREQMRGYDTEARAMNVTTEEFLKNVASYSQAFANVGTGPATQETATAATQFFRPLNITPEQGMGLIQSFLPAATAFTGIHSAYAFINEENRRKTFQEETRQMRLYIERMPGRNIQEKIANAAQLASTGEGPLQGLGEQQIQDLYDRLVSGPTLSQTETVGTAKTQYTRDLEKLKQGKTPEDVTEPVPGIEGKKYGQVRSKIHFETPEVERRLGPSGLTETVLTPAAEQLRRRLSRQVFATLSPDDQKVWAKEYLNPDFNVTKFLEESSQRRGIEGDIVQMRDNQLQVRQGDVRIWIGIDPNTGKLRLNKNQIDAARKNLEGQGTADGNTITPAERASGWGRYGGGGM